MKKIFSIFVLLFTLTACDTSDFYYPKDKLSVSERRRVEASDIFCLDKCSEMFPNMKYSGAILTYAPLYSKENNTCICPIVIPAGDVEKK